MILVRGTGRQEEEERQNPCKIKYPMGEKPHNKSRSSLRLKVFAMIFQMIPYSQLLLDIIEKILKRGIAPADGMIRAVLFDQWETIKVRTIKTFFDCEA
jgi:hypothetical protein